MLSPFQPSEKVLEQLLGILWCCRQMSIVKGQCGEQVRIRKIGMEQTAQPPLCVPLVEPLLDLRCRLLPRPSPFGFGVHGEYLHLHVLTAYMFPLSVYSLHLLPSL